MVERIRLDDLTEWQVYMRSGLRQGSLWNGIRGSQTIWLDWVWVFVLLVYASEVRWHKPAGSGIAAWSQEFNVVYQS